VQTAIMAVRDGNEIENVMDALASLSDVRSLTYMAGTPSDSSAVCCLDTKPSQAAMTR